MNPNNTACIAVVGTNTTIPQRIENVYKTLSSYEIYTTKRCDNVSVGPEQVECAQKHSAQK